MILHDMSQHDTNELINNNQKTQIDKKIVTLSLAPPAQQQFHYYRRNQYVQPFQPHYKCHTFHRKNEPCPFEDRIKQLDKIKIDLHYKYNDQNKVDNELNKICMTICPNCTHLLNYTNTLELAFHKERDCNNLNNKYCHYCGINSTHGNQGTFDCPILVGLAIDAEAAAWQFKLDNNLIPQWPPLHPTFNLSQENLLDKVHNMLKKLNLHVSQKVNLINNNQSNQNQNQNDSAQVSSTDTHVSTTEASKKMDSKKVADAKKAETNLTDAQAKTLDASKKDTHNTQVLNSNGKNNNDEDEVKMNDDMIDLGSNNDPNRYDSNDITAQPRSKRTKTTKSTLSVWKDFLLGKQTNEAHLQHLQPTPTNNLQSVTHPNVNNDSPPNSNDENDSNDANNTDHTTEDDNQNDDDSDDFSA